MSEARNKIYLLSYKIDPYRSLSEGLLKQVRATAGRNLDSVRSFSLRDYWVRPDGHYDYAPALEDRAEAYLLSQVTKYVEQRSYTVQPTTVIVVGVLDALRPTYEALASLHGYEVRGA